jgi:hypothetical protein
MEFGITDADDAGEISGIRATREMIAAGADARDAAGAEIIDGVADAQRELFAHGGEAEIHHMHVLIHQPAQRGEQGFGVRAQVAAEHLHADDFCIRRKAAHAAGHRSAMTHDVVGAHGTHVMLLFCFLHAPALFQAAAHPRMLRVHTGVHHGYANARAARAVEFRQQLQHGGQGG